MRPNKARVLGIDPGYGRMGVAVLESSREGQVILLFSDCLETRVGEGFPVRLGELQIKLRELIKKWKPGQVALEKLYFATNQKTVMQVAETRGMVIALTQEFALTLHEYTPLQVKVGITGYGRASKFQVAEMLHKLIRLEAKRNNRKFRDDEYDAIAVGVTDLSTRKH